MIFILDRTKIDPKVQYSLLHRQLVLPTIYKLPLANIPGLQKMLMQLHEHTSLVLGYLHE